MAAKNPTARPAALWLLASLPFIPLLLVFWGYSLPRSAEGAVMPLAGEGTDWAALRLPGGFATQGLKGEHLWLRRTFSAPAGIAGHDSVFVIGSVRGATLRLFFNGRRSGSRASPRPASWASRRARRASSCRPGWCAPRATP